MSPVAPSPVAPAARGYFSVQRLDAPAREPEQRLVVGQRFGGRIGKIGQQAEVQMVVAVGEKADLQRLDQAVDAFGAGEHRRDHHQRAQLRRKPLREIHPRQRVAASPAASPAS